MPSPSTRILILSGLQTYPESQLLDLVFPQDIPHPALAYIPPDGAQSPAKYSRYWQRLSRRRQARFLFINITSPTPQKEAQKLLSVNLLLLTGGNTFTFLYNLKKSGFDQAIIQFARSSQSPIRSRNEEFRTVPDRTPPKTIPFTTKQIAGFSAGAEVLTPSIRTAFLSPHPDKNTAGLRDFTGLGLVPFEIFPHFQPQYQSILENHQKTTSHRVVPLSDGQHLTINLPPS
jgi:peptidase E